MRRTLILMLAGIFLLAACKTEAGLRIHNPWVRATVAGENGAVYFVLHNHTDQDDELTSVTTDVTDIVEIHRTIIDPSTDIARMEYLQTLPIPADSEITFAPGKYHLMLIQLKRELKVGEHIGLVLHFKNHEDIVVNVAVQDAASEEDHDH